MSPVTVTLLAVSLSVVFTACSADPLTSPQALSAGDLKAAAIEIIKDVRNMADQAKHGMYLVPLHNKVVDIQTAASDLVQQLGGEVSECETKSVIKMAAAGTGSHEVLTVLLADDPVSVLNGRLSLALAFLEHVAQQLDNELPLSSEFTSHLSAIVFGTNTTATIIETADKTIRAMAASASENKHRVRRFLSADLGHGFSIGVDRGIQWQSHSGAATINLRPTFHGIRPNGVQLGFRFRF